MKIKIKIKIKTENRANIKRQEVVNWRRKKLDPNDKSPLRALKEAPSMRVHDSELLQASRKRCAKGQLLDLSEFE